MLPQPRRQAGVPQAETMGWTTVVQDLAMCRHHTNDPKDWFTILNAAWAITIGSYTLSTNVVYDVVHRNGEGALSIGPVRVVIDQMKHVKVFLQEIRNMTLSDCTLGHSQQLGINRDGKPDHEGCPLRTLLNIIAQEHMELRQEAERHMRGGNHLSVSCKINVDCRMHIAAAFSAVDLETWLVRRMLSHFNFVTDRLATILKFGNTSLVGDLTRTLNPQDLDKIWSLNHHVTTPLQTNLAECFGAKVQARPKSVAVEAWDGKVSYEQLHKLALSVARKIRSMGIAPHCLVAIELGRSLSAIVGTLGTLLAGCAFVPVDPAWPTIRKAEVMRSAQVSLSITSDSQSSRNATDTAASPMLYLPYGLDYDKELCRDIQPHVESFSIPSDSLAYVLFTSGSTGKPKGVAVEHGAICASLAALGRTFGLHDETRTLQFASLAFDISIIEILGTLIFGGCVCVPSDSERATCLPEYISAMQVNHASITPTVARQLDSNVANCLSLLVLGGEAVTAADARMWRAIPKLYNAYGPTECAVGCAAYQMNVDSDQSPLLGQLEGIPLWVVHPEDVNSLVPFGVVGELVVEGITLARGYLGDEHATKQSYISKPTWLTRAGTTDNERSGRVYRTGDLVRYNEHGKLVFVGRKESDSQVKIRGNRIDIGEVEHHIHKCLSHGAEVIVDTLVPLHNSVAPNDSDNANPMLVAFVRLQADNVLEQAKHSYAAQEDGHTMLKPMQVPKDLETHMRQLLPSYMIPSAFFSVLEWPRTSSDKTDRRRLRALASQFSRGDLVHGGASQVNKDSKRAPRTKNAKNLQSLWARLLGLQADDIGLDDSFFQLGGDSVTAMRLVRDARLSLGLRFTIADVFNGVTLEAISAMPAYTGNGDELGSQVPPFALLGTQEPNVISGICSDVAEACGLESVSFIQDVYPCTPLQEALLALSSKHQGTYTTQRVLQLSESVDVSKFREAWKLAVSRTSIMRTRITQHAEKGLVQVVSTPEAGLEWREVPADEWDAFLRMDLAQPMSVDGPLMRFAFSGDGKVDHGTRYFAWTVHHALYDGWCMPIMLERVRAAYEGRMLTDSTFADFMQHCVQTRSTAAASAREHWRRRLMNMDQAVTLPSVPPSVREPMEDCLREHRWAMPRDSSLNVTLATVLKAAWALVTCHYMGSEFAIFHTVVSGRGASMVGIEGVIGPTVATVPTLIHVRAEDSVKDLLRAVQDASVADIAFEQVGLQYIAELDPELAKVRDVQNFLVIQPDVYGAGEWKPFGHWTSGSGYNRYDTSALTLECFLGDAEGGDEVLCKAFFDSRCISPGVIERCLRQFGGVAQQLSRGDGGSARPQQVNEVQVLTPADRTQLWTWNRPLLAPAPAPDCLLHCYIARQAEDPQQAKKSAVDAWDLHLTYEQLEYEAAWLARKLIDTGVGPGRIVPLFFAPSGWVVVAMLAVLKTGAAFVALETAWPRAHRDRILSQLSPGLLLAASALSSDCSVDSTWRILAVPALESESESDTRLDPVLVPDEATPATATAIVEAEAEAGAEANYNANVNVNADADADADGSSTSPAVDQNAGYGINSDTSNELRDAGHAPAWLIFTSGTTGAPKGVLLSHVSLHTSYLRLGREYSIQRTTRMLQFSSFAFDASLFEIFAPLLHGGCVCVPSYTQQRSILHLPHLCNTLRVNAMILTPTVARLLDPATLTSLTSLILTGEPLQQNDIDRWAHLPYLANAYGPAECSNMCAVQRLPHGSDPCVFGRLEGVPNWVVCAHDVSKLCPIGGVGELLIEGPTVGSGYLNNPEKTAQVFISDLPWLIKGASGTDEDGRRGTLYRTGDLVRLDEHGRLCYIGRRDAQIKIRGQRLELGEVAHHVAACLQTPNVVIDLFATCPDNGEPVERLIAFVVRSSSASHETPRLLPHADHIVEKLVDTLPAYMIPYAYIEVSHMPKTLSGKRDVKRLRALAEELLAPTTQSHAQNRPVRLPRTRMEQLLQRSWKQALGSKAPDVIGLDDNFVKLGGDSITAMKLVSLARRLSLRLDVGNILWNRTLEQQARHVETSGAQELPVLEARAYSLLPSDCDLSTVLLEVADACRCEKEFIEDLYPCTPAQEGLLAITTMHETTDMKPYVLQHVFDIPATVDMQRLCRAWETIVQRTHILRTRIVNHKRLGLLQVLIKEDVRWHEIENIDQFLMADKGASMDLGGLLVRFAISRTSCSRGSKLVWTIHHALADGTTLELVLQRVFDQYQNPDQTCPVAEFRPFVAYLGQLDRAGTVQYWTKMLHAVTNTPFPALPSTINYPVEDSEVVRDCTLPTMINGASHGFPFSVLVKSAWAIVQSRHSSSTDVVFGEVLSGRNAAMPLIDTLVGPSMVTLPFRTDLRRSQTVHDLLKNVQDAALSTIPHEQIGLQEIARINDDCSAACSFQTLLIVQPELALEDRIDRPPAFLASPSYKLATYALGIEVTPRSSGQQGCRIRCRYDSHAVSHPLAERLVAQLANVMVQLVTSTSDSLLTRISVLPLDELARLWEFNVRDDFHDLTSISDTIGRHVCRSPSAQAIRAWDGELTYVELDRLSEGLAGQLRALSNSQAQGQDGNQNQQTYIALCFERSLWMTVALVAVLKAGFAAVPLDVAHPESRIRKMLARLGPSGTILASKHQKRAKTFPDNWISHEVSAETITCKPREEWAPKALEYNSGMPRADADCFVLFTSGSTGEPKGVALQYRAIFSNLSRLIHTLGIDHATGVLQYSSHAFDAAMFENLGALLAGGCLCIPSEQQRLESLADFCNQSGVNFAMLTPSVARIYQPKDLACLKSLVLIGETPRAEDIYRWQGLDVEIWNGYGPTEASFLVALHRYDLTKDKDFSPYLGRVPRVPLWLVNCTGNDTLAPLGAVGEIWIEDVSNVARAYKGDRDQTANSFVENPLWLAEGVPGRVSGRSGRLYKTGDLAWQAENGDLMFVGRKDTQIKFRGQRIELAEIESRLLSCAPSATEVVVENLPYGKGQHKADTLVAFIRTLTCPDQAETFAPLQSARAVEEELRKHLPTYMVPKFFVSVRDIPQTTTGKTDRKRLRREGLAYLMVMSGPDRTSNLPLTPIESTLRCLWAQVLDIDEGSITRMGHFFALGGDSIRAMRLVYSFRNMQLGLTAADIFKYPHLYEQAQRLAGCTASELVSTGLHGDAMLSLLPTAVDPTKLRDSIAQTCKVHPSSIEDIYPCTPMQEGLMAITFQSPGAYTLRLKFDLAEDVNLDRLRAAWERTIASTAILRTRIVYDPLCGFVQVALPLVIWDWKEVEKEALVQPSPTGTGQPFSHWALIRHSTQNARGRACLIWTIHHSLYDQITLNLILTMLVSGYRQEALTPRPPYSSFIRSILAARSMEADEFWRLSLMNNASTIFPCPVGPRSLTPFDEDVFEMTCDLPPRTGNRTTIAILLRAAWAIVAGWHTSNTDVVFGDLRSGRAASIPDIDSIPGPTIATIPFRIVLDPSEPIHTFLDRVHSIYAKSIEFEQTGLSRISKISDDCARACRFETLLALQAGASPRASSMHGSNEIWREVRVEDFAMRTYSLLVECWVESAGSLSVKATRNVNVCSSMLVKTLLHQFTAVASQLIMHTRDSNSDKVVGDIESPEPDDWHGFTSRTEQHRGQQWLVSVDNHDRLAPLGTIGELLLEDETVTENLSYPSQTQYVERPQFLAKANARPSCVLTGILARYDEDAGSMRCIGRKSELVTTDGTIVDPAPIESLIRSATESCTQAVVTLLPSSPHDGLGGKQRLAAFLCFTSPFLQPSVPEPGSMRWYADAAAVQHQLSKWLPQHLLPSQYLQLDWLPQGVWGGPDRTSLAELGGAHIARYGDQQNTTLLRHQPPVSSSQLAMAELWSGLLEIPTDTLSLDDNFFDLGADSVTAMALVARARKRNVKLTVAGVLRHPTLEGMTACAIFDEVNGLPKADPFSLFTGSSVDEPLDLESLMQRDIIPHLNYDRCAVADVLPCTAMQSEFLRMGGVYYNIEIDLSDVKIDLRRMQRAVNLLIDRHSILRTIFLSPGKEFLQVVLHPGSADLFRVLEIAPSHDDAVVTAGSISELPLFELVMDDRDTTMGHAKLAIRGLSHARFDGYSLPFILRDLAMLYDGHDDSLPPAAQFTSFVYYTASISAGMALEYWSRHLDGACMNHIPHLSAPSIAVGQEAGSTSFRSLRVVLPFSDWEQCCEGRQTTSLRKQKFSSDTVLVALWAVTLAVTSASNDVLFGHTVLGRFGIPQLPGGGAPDSVLGPCVNTVPLRVRFLDTGPEQTFQELLEHITRLRLASTPFESSSIEAIVNEYTSSATWPGFAKADCPWDGARYPWGSTVVWQDFHGLQQAQHDGLSATSQGAVTTGVGPQILDPFEPASTCVFAGRRCALHVDLPQCDSASRVSVIGRQVMTGPRDVVVEFRYRDSGDQSSDAIRTVVKTFRTLFNLFKSSSADRLPSILEQNWLS